MKVTSNKETTTTVKIILNNREKELLLNIMLMDMSLPDYVKSILDNKHSDFFKKFMYDLSKELKK